VNIHSCLCPLAGLCSNAGELEQEVQHPRTVRYISQQDAKELAPVNIESGQEPGNSYCLLYPNGANLHRRDALDNRAGAEFFLSISGAVARLIPAVDFCLCQIIAGRFWGKWMTWLLIVLILALIIGPILVLIPSPRQKELTAFRKEAKSRGISVELCTIEDPDPDPDPGTYLSATGKPLDREIKCISYRVSRKRPFHWRRLPRIHWQVIQTKDANLEELPAGWKWHDSTADVAEAIKQALMIELERLPEDVIAVDENNYIVSVYWHEKGGDEAMRGVCGFLEKIALVETSPEELDSDMDVPE
jgi:hypothetical protein